MAALVADSIAASPGVELIAAPSKSPTCRQVHKLQALEDQRTGHWCYLGDRQGDRYRVRFGIRQGDRDEVRDGVCYDNRYCDRYDDCYGASR